METQIPNQDNELRGNFCQILFESLKNVNTLIIETH